MMEWLALNPISPPCSQKSEIKAASEYQWFHISLKNIHIPQSRLEFLNAQGRHQTKSLIQYIQWFSATTLQHAHPDLLYQRCRAAPVFGEGQHSPVLQLQPFFTYFPTCHPSQTTAPEACIPTPDSELWHSCLAGTGGNSCPKTMVTTAHPAASWVLPGPELLYPRKNIFPKGVWGEGERHRYNPAPAPPSKTKKEKKPQPRGCINANTSLKREGRAGYSHGKSARNTDPELHSPAEPEPPVLDPEALAPHATAAVPGREPSWGNVWELPPLSPATPSYPVHICFLNTTC